MPQNELTPAISIITINYNNALGLEKTLESVRMQVFTDYEHIIVDGGSTDESKNIILKFLNIGAYSKHISYWCSEEDYGIYNAMNKGIAHANGLYCLFLNSGDTLCNQYVLRDCIDDICNADIISGREVFSNKTVWVGISEKKMNLFNYMNSFIPHGSTFIKTKILKERKYDESYRIISDYIFFFKELFIFNSTYKTIPAKISNFCLDGISSNNKQLAESEMKDFFQKNLPKYILDLYYNWGGDIGVFDIVNNKFLILCLKIWRRTISLIKRKLMYYF